MWIVISDTHIGDKHSNENLPKLFSFLEEFSSLGYNLILNGDIFDFAKCLEFDERHRTFINIVQKFKRVIYIEGNHDWFVSGLKKSLGRAEFKKEFILNHNNKIIKVIHGHQTDNGVVLFPRLNRFLVRMNSWFYNLTGLDIQHKLRKLKIVQKLFQEKQATKLIRKERFANILIAGHTHQPGIRNECGIQYFNTGDWVETDHCYFAVIKDDSTIELIKV